MQNAATASRTSAVSLPNDWERTGKTLQSRLDIDLNLIREQLKDALLDYEEENPGNNLVGSKCYEFLRHVQNLVWKDLDALKAKDVEAYEAWRRGERGYWPLKTNNAAHTALLKLSERRRVERGIPGLSDQPGLSVQRKQKFRNRDKTTYNWRRKTTAEWIYQDGRRECGFPFFMGWTHLDRFGNHDPKGRAGFIGYVNLKWIFGPDWSLAENQKCGENQPLEIQQAEKITAIPRFSNRPSEKSEKKEEKRFAAQPVSFVSAVPTTFPEPAHPQQQTGKLSAAAFPEEKKIVVTGTACGDTTENPAFTPVLPLWELLLRLVYAPLFGTGRIRYAPAFPYERADFKPFMQRKCVELLAENLHAARKRGEITLDDAVARLITAIEAQGKYLKDNPEAWILTPDKYLLAGKSHGTLLSAMQHFVREKERPLLSPEVPENEDSRQRRMRLYKRLLSFGATTPPGVFSRWCVKHRFTHVEACMDYMAQIITRRRNAGKLPGKEFDNRQGGAAAYFASLIARYDSTAQQREADRLERIELKRHIWQTVDGYHSNRILPPDRESHRQALIALYHRLKPDSELLAIAVREAEAAFEIRFTDDNFLSRFENLALFEHILKSEKCKP